MFESLDASNCELRESRKTLVAEEDDNHERADGSVSKGESKRGAESIQTTYSSETISTATDMEARQKLFRHLGPPSVYIRSLEPTITYTQMATPLSAT